MGAVGTPGAHRNLTRWARLSGPAALLVVCVTVSLLAAGVSLDRAAALSMQVRASNLAVDDRVADPVYVNGTCKDSKSVRRAARKILRTKDPTAYPAVKRLYEGVIANGDPQDRACATVRLAKLLQREKDEADKKADKPGWEQDLQKSVTAWVKKHFDPLKDVALPTAGIVLLLLVLARLLTGALVRTDLVAPAEWVRRTWWAFGLALVLLAGASLPVAVSVEVEGNATWPRAAAVATLLALTVMVVPRPTWRPGRPELAVAIAGAATVVLALPPPGGVSRALGLPAWKLDLVLIAGAWAAAVGVVLMALARGLALAIEVQVRGSSGADNSSHARTIVARLQQLGSDNPRDIRMLGAADMTSLPEDALTAVPDGAVAVALFNLLKVLRPAAPWRVTVTQPDDATLVMDITRNRTAVADGTLVVSAAEFPTGESRKSKKAAPDASKDAGKDAAKDGSKDSAKPGSLDEFLTAAASQTLLALSGPHRELAAWLCGATTWQALTFHAIAGRPGVSPERRFELLHAAIDASPRYLMPRMAVVQDIDDTDAAGRLRYAKTLDELWTEFATVLGGPEALNDVYDGYRGAQLRLLYNQAVAWINVRADFASAERAARWRQADAEAAEVAAAADAARAAEHAVDARQAAAEAEDAKRAKHAAWARSAKAATDLDDRLGSLRGRSAADLKLPAGRLDSPRRVPDA